MSPSTALRKLITNYNEVNVSTIDELASEPSPLEFMRYVARNRPFVVRAGARHWLSVKKWDSEYLKQAMAREGQGKVNVAVTPFGNADSVTVNPADGQRYFVKPLEVDEPFGEFLEYVQRQELEGSREARGEVKYAQTQNDNLRNEYSTLYSDVEPNISWARIALQHAPDAINLWLGNSRSVTALHRDNYENVYVQILGRKHFVLMPPVEMPCVSEGMWRGARYVRDESTSSNSEGRNLVMELDEDETPIPFTTWDPDIPDEDATPFSALSRPLRINLDPGDMLYLPALWYHKVSQTCSDEGICCAVNYWYDMDFNGAAYAHSVFVRDVALEVAGTEASGEPK